MKSLEKENVTRNYCQKTCSEQNGEKIIEIG
jgi:hypothetical protein